MSRIYKLSLTAVILAAMVLTTPAYALAAALPDYVLITDADGISVDASGQYFIDAVDLKPGDVITRQLLIRNLESYACQITLRAEPMDETGPLHLLDEVYLVLDLDEKTIYEGRVRGDQGANIIQNALNLGIYPSGTSRTLKITMTVNPDMKPHFDQSEAFFRWIFYAVRTEGNTATQAAQKPAEYEIVYNPASAPEYEAKNEPERIEVERNADNDVPDGLISAGEEENAGDSGWLKGPQTGDTMRYGLYIFTAILSLISLVLLFLMKKREKKPESK